MKFFVLLSLIFSFGSFAQEDCGSSKDDTQYSSLRWHNAIDYKIDSSYIDINGFFCVGFDSFNHIKRFHYRDDQGLKIYKTIDELTKKDIIFFKQSDFPRSAQYVTRNTPALTIKINNIHHTHAGDEVSLSVKFLRNVAKGLTKNDIRELLIDYKLDGNQAAYNNTEMTKMYLDISGILVVNEIHLYNGSSYEQTIKTKYLKQAFRDY